MRALFKQGPLRIDPVPSRRGIRCEPDTLKKVIHLTTSHRPTDTRILKRECTALAEIENYQVTLFNAYGVNDEYGKVKITSIDRRRSRYGRYSISLLRAIRAVIKAKPDLVHVHDPELLLAVYFFRKRQINVIVDVHEKYADKFTLRSWVPKILSPLLVRVFNWLVRYVDRHASGIVTAAPFLLEDFNSAKRVCVRNFPDLQHISEVVSESPRQENLVIYTGGLSEHRGIEPVIKALTGSSEDWKLIVYGQRSPAVAERLGDLLNDTRIEYRGLAPFEEVVKAMKQASVGVVCNEAGLGFENALPNKVFEYMASGIAIVCSNFPEWKKLVEDNQAGTTCDPQNADSVRQAIFSYLWNPAKVAEAGKRGKYLVETQYSWSNEKQKLYELYGEILQ